MSNQKMFVHKKIIFYTVQNVMHQLYAAINK